MKGLKVLNRMNKKGNAAMVALLVMIIIVGVAAIVMVLAGRNSIDEEEKFKQNSTTSTQTTAPVVTSATTPTTPAVVDLYPKNDPSFKNTSIKDFGSDASLLVDLDTDTILAGSNINKRIYPASLTKVMTILVAAENLRSYDDTYTFKDSDFTKLVEEKASMAGFKPGEKVVAKDLFYGAILPSGADAVVGLENLVAGSEKNFVKLMNDRAKELGLKNTHFVNGTGIHDPNHYTTAADMAVIMKVANHNITCKNVMNTFDYTTSRTTQNPEGIHLTCLLGGRLSGYYVDKNGNGANDDNVKILGGKTGFTNEACYCVATTCEDTSTGHTFVCITIKSPTDKQAILDTISMYEKYLPGSKAKIPDAEVTTTAATAKQEGVTTAATKKAAAVTTKKKAA